MVAVLVTGAGGYLGAHVLAQLRGADRAAVGLARRDAPGLEACDLLDAASLARVMERLKPDRIVHCAWATPQSLAEYDDDNAAQSGIAMLENLLAATEVPVVYASSMTVYGRDNRTLERGEADAGHPETAYGRAKWAAEQRLAASGRPGFSVRLPGLFGGSRHDGLVHHALRALKEGRTPELPAYPLLWAAMDVRCAAASLARLCNRPCEAYVPVNVGYADVYSISRLVELLGELTGRPAVSTVNHPDFAFDLSCARALDVAPEQSLRGACRRLLEELP